MDKLKLTGQDQGRVFNSRSESARVTNIMEQYALKNVNNCLNTNIYSYLVTPVAHVIKAFTVVKYASGVILYDRTKF